MSLVFADVTNMTFRNSPCVGILADDLTSAADGAGPFVQSGLRADVGRKRLPEGAAEVIAVDMATRSQPVAEAVVRTRRATQALDRCRILFKTVDSTLRGHVRAEIGATLEASCRSRLVLAPAFPAAGRTTREGVQLVEGVPVSESPYAEDPVHPVTGSQLADLVPSVKGEVLLLDAETQPELTEKVAEIENPEEVLWAGSPGLAIALSQLISPKPVPFSVPATSGEVLVVVGSANRLSAQQAAALSGLPRATVLSAPPGRSDPAQVLAALTSSALAELETGRYGALLATGGDTMEALLEAAGLEQFSLCGEFEPGFPVGATVFREAPLLLGLKAGGFGKPDTFRRAVCRLMNSENPST